MIAISKAQIGLIKGVCIKNKIESADLAYDYSKGRTQHVSQLYKDEATQLIKWLLNSLKVQVTPKEKMMRKILSLAHELHWELSHASRHGKSNKVDMAKLDEWCMRYGQFHKPLDQHNEMELTKLVTQFQYVHKDFLKGVR